MCVTFRAYLTVHFLLSSVKLLTGSLRLLQMFAADSHFARPSSHQAFDSLRTCPDLRGVSLVATLVFLSRTEDRMSQMTPGHVTSTSSALCLRPCCNHISYFAADIQMRSRLVGGARGPSRCAAFDWMLDLTSQPADTQIRLESDVTGGWDGLA